MNTISMILYLSTIVLSLSGPSMGFDLGWGEDSDDEYTWYSSEAPGEVGGLLDKGIEMGPEGKHDLSIVDSTEKKARTSLDIPMGAWAKLMLAPSLSGELQLYCRYPTGTVDLLLAEDVEGDNTYVVGYLAEWGGDYEVWYVLDGSKSNSVRFHVKDYWDMDEAALSASGPFVGGAPGSGSSGGGMSKSMRMAPASPVAYSYSAPAAASPNIGLSAGGAKDVNNFRENIDQDYLPLPTDLTYEGLFYDYYFDTGTEDACQKSFCPSYSYAISKDPFSKEPQHYLSVGLNSGITDFQRKKLNLVVVLDYSGSMGSPFSEYYYDRFGNRVDVGGAEGSGKTKMEIADQAVVDLLSHLEEDDRFGMVIFSNDAFVVEPLTEVGDKNQVALKERILDIEEDSGTNMESGMEKGTALFRTFLDADPSERENRIIFLTDAMPNLGLTGKGGLFSILEENADHRLYTTFIGIGVDFNTELVEEVTKIKGANYYSVHSASEFDERMDEEFDYMVTPLVFDLLLDLDASGYQIEKVYGSPEADEATGEIMKVNTLFPSKAESGAVKGGVVLIKLKQISPDGNIRLKVSYEDRNGKEDGSEALVIVPDAEPDFYQNSGIHKAILLSRYSDLLKSWMTDERSALETGEPVSPTVSLARGIVLPPELGEWERQSLPLKVSEPYSELFSVFGTYFEQENEAIGDIDLQQEEIVLDKLSSYSQEPIR